MQPHAFVNNNNKNKNKGHCSIRIVIYLETYDKCMELERECYIILFEICGFHIKIEFSYKW